MNYCVLSLAYCVYIASSIFLLQVQAAPDDQQAMRKLTYCIQCLHQVRQISPGKSHTIYCCNCFSRLFFFLTKSGHIVIASALNNINKELTALGIALGPSINQIPRTHTSPPPGSNVNMSGSAYQTSPDMGRQNPVPSHPVYQPSFSHNFGPDAMSMEPGVFEAMSTLEPLSIRVGTIPESENPPSFG